MNHQVVIAIAVVTAYLVWLAIFILVIERWLRVLTARLFGVTITCELQTFSGPSTNISLLDIFDVYRWRVNQPASLSVRLGVGLLRLSFWFAAVMLPLVLAIAIVMRD